MYIPAPALPEGSGSPFRRLLRKKLLIKQIKNYIPRLGKKPPHHIRTYSIVFHIIYLDAIVRIQRSCYTWNFFVCFDFCRAVIIAHVRADFKNSAVRVRHSTAMRTANEPAEHMSRRLVLVILYLLCVSDVTPRRIMRFRHLPLLCAFWR